MTSDGVHSRVTEALHRVLKTPMSARDEFIHRSFANDPEVLEELQSLLNQSTGSSGRFERPVASVEQLIERHHQISAEHYPVIPGFQIIRLLGQGSSSTVYLAEQADPSRNVAIKVIRPSHATPENIIRMRAEAHFLARLDHVSISRIFETGLLEGPLTVQPYLVMEYVSGLSLTAFSLANQCTSSQKITLMSMLCEAVHLAHQQGVFHRDLKPSNILVCSSPNTNDPLVKVIDFGIAKLVGEAKLASEPETLDPRTLGTRRYMSPERLNGKSGGGSAASDIFSLGVVAAELFGYSIEHLRASDALLQGSGRFFRGHPRHQRIARRVKRTIEHMLDPLPHHRPESASIAAAMLQGEYAEAWYSHASLRMRHAIRSRSFFLVMTLVGTALFLGLLVGFFYTDRADNQNSKEPAPSLARNSGLEVALDKSSPLIGLRGLDLRFAVGAKIQLVLDHTEAGLYDQALQIHEDLRDALGDLDLLPSDFQCAVFTCRAYTLRSAGQLDDAEELYLVARDCISLENMIRNKKIARHWTQVAHGLMTCENYELASEMYSELIEHPSFADLSWEYRCESLSCYGGLFWLQGDMATAEQLLRDAIDSPPSPGTLPEQLILADKESSLGVVLRDQNRFEEAYVFLSRGLERAIQFQSSTHPSVCRYARNLAVNYLHMGEFASSRQLIELSRSVWMSTPERWVSELCEADLVLATIELEQGSVEVARARILAALDRATGLSGLSIDRAMSRLQNALGTAL